MESSLTKLGGSLKVPLVQELAKTNLTTVPSRYVRIDCDLHVPTTCSSSPKIPTIDFQKLYDSKFTNFELDKLHKACQEWGFFQVINHGVDTEILETMKLEIQEFFNLPIEEKNKFNQEAGDVEGYGQAFVVSEEQKLDWADLFYIVTQPTHLRKSHLIPKLPPRFRDAIDSYSKEMKTLGMAILHQMAKALKMEAEEIDSLFGEGLQSMRMNYYPPCPQPELVTGLCPHSDAAGLTILLQVNDMMGLQIKKDGLWIPVSPLPGAFVVNIGDALEVLTNGIYRSIEHRATTNSQKERLSIATFLTLKLEANLDPSPSLLGSESPARFKTIGAADFLRAVFSGELKGKSNLEALRI